MTTKHSDGTTRRFTLFGKQVIMRADEQPYLTRWIIFRCPWFAVYLHRFDGPDDMCLHDHPWWFVSLILWGGYWEVIGNHWNQWRNVWCESKRRWMRPGSILVRRAECAHRIELEPGRKPWTLVITGPKRRQWGFYSLKGWKAWFSYSHAEHCQ